MMGTNANASTMNDTSVNMLMRSLRGDGTLGECTPSNPSTPLHSSASSWSEKSERTL